MGLIVSIREIFEVYVFSRNVKQIFIQWDYSLERSLITKRPSERSVVRTENQQSDSYLHALKPMYDFSESLGHWWLVFESHDIVDLGMKQFIIDPILFQEKRRRAIHPFCNLVDDTLAGGNDEFLYPEKIKECWWQIMRKYFSSSIWWIKLRKIWRRMESRAKRLRQYSENHQSTEIH